MSHVHGGAFYTFVLYLYLSKLGAIAALLVKLA
jgi:hypothetical protein